MATLIHDRVAAARDGTNPTVICRVPSGWVVIGDTQFLRGYALLLADPVVPSLNAIDAAGRQTFLRDMAILGDALLDVTDAFRINYEILGNTEAALHAHVFPRYRAEPEDFRRGPVWCYDRETRRSAAFDAARDKALMDAIAQAVRSRL